jgi:cardiolipin synthase C
VFYKAALLTLFLLPSVSSGEESYEKVKEHPGNGRDSASILKALKLSADQARNSSGLLTLETGGASLISRLWLLDQARHSVDIQYFSFARNITGLIASEYLVRAAERGVKVRLLIDELSGKLNAREIKILDRHRNIEVRVYNAGAKLGRADKKVKYLAKNHRRLMRRMHNKTMTIDGVASIIGGRNISDEYFDFDHKYNFRDRDVLMLGAVARQVRKSFSDFWESPLTVTCEELVGKTDKAFTVDALFAKLREFRKDTAAVSGRLRQKVDSFPVLFGTLAAAGDFHWISSLSFISDVPGKNEERADRKGGLCDDSITSLIRNANMSIDIHTPYFITTEETRKLLTDAVQRGVRVRVLTNSLASIDNDVAFSPYKRDRKKNLKTGIALYEFRPDPAVRFRMMTPDVQACLHYEPLMGLHTKCIVVDGQTAVVGSFNPLEPRSANLNTECIVVVRSKEMSHRLSKLMADEFLPENAWRITEEFNPDRKASLKKRLKVMIGHLVPKKLL